MTVEAGQILAADQKGHVGVDVRIREVRAAASLIINPVATIEIIDNAAIAGTSVSTDTTASGGGVDNLLEGVAWNAGATAAASATALAAAMQAALQVHDATWTAVAVGAVITATLTGEFATGEGCDVSSDAPGNYLLQGERTSILEAFTLFQAGDGYGNENDIEMGGTDFLYLFIMAAPVVGSAMTQLRIRVQYGVGYAPDTTDFYDEVALDQGAAAGGVLPVTLPIVEYQLPVTAGRLHRATVAIPVDAPVVRVLAASTGLPDADDTVEILYLRLMRDSVTPSS